MCQAASGDASVVIDHFARVGVDGTIREADVADPVRPGQAQARHASSSQLITRWARKQPPYDDLLPMVRRVLDAFGPERCMWASDAPYQVQPPHTYAASIALIRDRANFLSAGDRRGC